MPHIESDDLGGCLGILGDALVERAICGMDHLGIMPILCFHLKKSKIFYMFVVRGEFSQNVTNSD